MKVKTSEILISQKVQDAISENWISAKHLVDNPEILDGEIRFGNEFLETTLRIPYQIKGINGHMLINGNLIFTNRKNLVVMSIFCDVIKPGIIFTFLGFLTSLVFVLPSILINLSNLMYFFIAGIGMSFVYFGLFYLKLRRITTLYLRELTKKAESVTG